MTERRKFKRFKAIIKGIVNILGEDKSKSTIDLLDFSKEGARLLANDSLNEGSEIELELNIPGDNMPLFASGEIAWSKRKETSFFSGIKFTKMDYPDRTRLLGHVYGEWIKNKE